MKQKLALIAIAALVTFGCQKTESTNSETTETSATTASDTMSTSSTMSTTDSSGTAGTAGTSSTTGTTTVSSADQEFMTKAAIGGMAEVNLGNVAAQKGTNADVKAFGNQMVTDHSKANDELKALAAQKGVTLPADVDAEQKKKADEVSAKSGKDFDKAYMADMVEDHEKDVKEFEKASKDAQDPDLKAWAAKTLPTLQHHLQMAKDTKGKVK
jgi:putative membrane protein